MNFKRKLMNATENLGLTIGWFSFIISIVVMLAVIATIVGFGVMGYLGTAPETTPVEKIMLFFASGLSFFLINVAIKNKMALDEINAAVTKQPNEVATVKILRNQEEFYTALQAAIMGAKERVYLTHLDDCAPDSAQYNDDTRKNYFEFSVKFATKHPNVTMKRIMSLPTKDKFAWIVDFLNDTRDLKKLHLAYLEADSLEAAASPRTIVSCQIIDYDKIFILNPALNTVPCGDFNPCIYIENPEVVKVYAKYYEDLWHDIHSGVHKGCILKDGPILNTVQREKVNAKLAKIKAHIDAVQKDEKEPLREKNWFSDIAVDKEKIGDFIREKVGMKSHD